MKPFHEPKSRSGVPPLPIKRMDREKAAGRRFYFGGSQTVRFMVPMRVKNGVEATHESGQGTMDSIRGIRLIRGPCLSVFCACFCLFVAISSRASDLKKDEEIIFFPVVGQKVDKGAFWEAEIHAWVYEPERRALELEVLRKALGVKREETTETENALFTERARTFMVDNERGKNISVRIGEKVYPVGKTGPDGRVLGRIRIPASDVTSDRVSFYAVLPAGDARVFAGEIHLLDDTGLSVISDIDDTIKVSEIRDRKALLMNTFFRPFQPVPGMSGVYQSWARNAVVKFHYLSASPWQLYPYLADFLLGNDFPTGTFHLKPLRWKDETFFDLFKSPEGYKLSTIEPFLRKFPNRRFVLVGDSGEKDPEIYATIARKVPKQIVRIMIRDVTNEAADSPRYQQTFKGLPSGLWKVFRDPKEVADAVPR